MCLEAKGFSVVLAGEMSILRENLTDSEHIERLIMEYTQI